MAQQEGIKHIIYDTREEALDRAKLHNESRGENQRFSRPRRTSGGKYVLVVNDYNLSDHEESRSSISAPQG